MDYGFKELDASVGEYTDWMIRLRFPSVVDIVLLLLCPKWLRDSRNPYCSYL
jgi:hypothetical protein